MDINLKKRILSLSDEELLNLYERDYEDYRREALECAKEEIRNRGIEKKIWFYNDWFKKYGPYSRDEIIELVRNKEIKKDFHLWREGLSDWIEVKDMNLFGDQEIGDNHTSRDNDSFNKNETIKPPPFNPGSLKSKASTAIYDYEGGKSGVKVAGILMTIMGGIWSSISILQLFTGMIEYNTEYFMYAGWNLVVAIGMIIIGQGVVKHKKWSYSWGVGTSGINIIFHVIEFISGEININVFFTIIHIAVFVLLSKNKKVFENKKIESKETTDS